MFELRKRPKNDLCSEFLYLMVTTPLRALLYDVISHKFSCLSGKTGQTPLIYETESSEI